MRKWQRVTLAAALTAATAGGLAVGGTAANAKPAATESGGQAAAASFHGRGSVAANIRVVETFLQDVLDGHHGDHAASYLTEDAQFHAGTVGNFTGRGTVAGVLAGIVAAVPDLHADVQDIFGHGDEVIAAAAPSVLELDLPEPPSIARVPSPSSSTTSAPGCSDASPSSSTTRCEPTRTTS